MVALALAVLWRGDGFFLVFWMVASLGVLWEWQRLVGERRFPARFLAGGATLALAGNLATAAAADSALAALVVGAAATAAIAGDRRAWSAAGLLYAGALLISVCLLRFSIFDGAEAVLWLFAIVWGSDVMAYFTGRLLGGPKLWPRLSPGKTWSGFLGGIGSGALLGLIVLGAVGASTPWLPALGLGVLIGAASQGGDLFESFVKRRFGAKDSGGVIPGHGGLMDRLDGFIAATALAALIGIIRYDAASAALGLLRW